MRQLALLASFLLSSVAGAEPCVVTIVRSPDDVRAAIERWVAQEASCTSKLEVRVVPSDGGFYLIARDDRGRLHERLVPTAESAGVLVASWIADASAPGAPVRAVEPDAGAAVPDAGPRAADERAEGFVTSAPGEAPVRQGAEGTPPAPGPDELGGDRLGGDPVRAVATRRWLVVGPVLGMSDGGGFGARLEVDFKRVGGWAFGGAVAASQSHVSAMTSAFEMLDTKAIAYVHRVGTRGAWELRGGAGLGLTYTQATQFDGLANDGADGIGPTVELSARVTRTFGAWAIGVGPIATFYAQRFRDVDRAGGTTDAARGLELVGFASLQHRM